MNDPFTRLTGIPSEDPHVDALRLVLELGVESAGAQEGSVLILDARSQELIFLMTGGDMLSEATLTGQRVRVGEGLTGMAAKTGDIQIGAPVLRSVAQPAHHQFKAPTQIIAAPMLAGRSVVGVLTAASYVPDRRFSNDEVRLFGRFASMGAIIVAEHRHTRSADGSSLALADAKAGSKEIAWW